MQRLAARRVNLFDFEKGMSELSTQLGGAIDHPHSTPMSAWELFQRLDTSERHTLEFYYRKKVRELAKEWRTKFPSLFLEPSLPASE